MIKKDKWEEICAWCGYVKEPHDQYTNFGCSSYDPPEPLDPEFICKDCFPYYKDHWLKIFKEGGRYGDWQKSRAEIEAAKECNLKWVGSGGHGMLGSKDFARSYQYITKKEYDRLSKFPYYGYCKICGAENKHGYCSNKKCEKSFEMVFKENRK